MHDQCHYQRPSLDDLISFWNAAVSGRDDWQEPFELVNNALPMETLNLVIDDTLIPRQSVKAPGSIIRRDHARKPDRSFY